MPILQGNSDQMLAMAMQMITQANERRRQQGIAQVNVALPGQTVADLGMSEKQFAQVFGKDTPYNPNRVLHQELPEDVKNRLTTEWLKTLNPMQQLDIVATKLNNDSGLAGPQTMKGLEAARSTAETKAVSGQHTAESVAQMIDTGIAQMKKETPEVQGRIGQQAAFGTTADQQQADLQSNLLKMSALKEAIGAQTNPNAPIHKFLGTIGLDLPTVLASVAMGTTNLLDSYSRAWAGSRQAGFDVEAALEKAEIESAKEISERTFGGKLTVRQVLMLQRAQNSGDLPKNLQGAYDVYSRGVGAAYEALFSEMIAKGDPIAQGIASQIGALTKPGVDPNTVSAVNDLATRNAAYLITKKMFGGQVPTDAAGIKSFNDAMTFNLARMPKGGVHFPLLSIGSSQNPSGLGTGQITPPNQQVAPTDNAPAVRPVSPVAPVSGVPANILPQLTDSSGNQLGQQTPQLAPDQQEAIMRYLQSIGVGAP